MPRLTHLILIDPRCIIVSMANSSRWVREYSLAAVPLEANASTEAWQRSLGWAVVPGPERAMVIGESAESLAHALPNVSVEYPFEGAGSIDEGAKEAFVEAVLDQVLGQAPQSQVLLSVPEQGLDVSRWTRALSERCAELRVTHHSEALAPEESSETEPWTWLLGEHVSLGSVSLSSGSLGTTAASLSRESLATESLVGASAPGRTSPGDQQPLAQHSRKAIRVPRGLGSAPPSFREADGTISSDGQNTTIQSVLEDLLAATLQQARGDWGAQPLPPAIRVLAPQPYHAQLEVQIGALLRDHGLGGGPLHLATTGSWLHRRLFQEIGPKPVPRAIRPREERTQTP